MASQSYTVHHIREDILGGRVRIPVNEVLVLTALGKVATACIRLPTRALAYTQQSQIERGERKVTVWRVICFYGARMATTVILFHCFPQVERPNFRPPWPHFSLTLDRFVSPKKQNTQKKTM